MKANAVKANATPPQPDENFFPSTRTKAVLSDDQTKKTCDRRAVAPASAETAPKKCTRL